MDPRPAKRRRVAEPQNRNHLSYGRRTKRDRADQEVGSPRGNLRKRNAAVVEVTATVDDVVSVVVKVNDDGIATSTATVATSQNPSASTTPVNTPASALTSSTRSTSLASSSSSIPSPSTSSRPVQTSTSTSTSRQESSTSPSTGVNTPMTSSVATSPVSSSDLTLTPSTFPSFTIVPTNASSTLPSASSTTSLVNILLPTPSNFTSFSNSTLFSQLFLKNATTTSVDTIVESTTTIDESTSSTPFASTSLAPIITYTSTVTPPPVVAAPTTASSKADTSATSNTANENKSTLPLAPPQTIAGAVTGSVGATAVIVCIVWFLLRWYRSRLESKSSATLTGGSRPFAKLRGRPTHDSEMAVTRNNPSLLTAAAAGWLPAAVRNKDRDTANASVTDITSQSGFQKVQGRKLPSQFGHDSIEAPMFRDFALEDPFVSDMHGANMSTSMTGPTGLGLGFGHTAENRPATRNNLHRSMFSDQATYTESRLSRGDDLDTMASTRASQYMNPTDYARPERETVMPGPARTPVIRSGLYFIPPSGMYRDSQQRQTMGRGVSEVPSQHAHGLDRSSSHYSDPFADAAVSPPITPRVAEIHDAGVIGTRRNSSFAEIFRRTNS